MPPATRSTRDDLRRVLRPSAAPAEAGATEEKPRLERPGARDAAVLVPLYLRGDELHVVLTRRREQLRRHPGEISFPGGRYEDGERDLRATALREAGEEIGLAAGEVEIVGTLPATQTLASGYVVHPFVGLIEPGRTWALSAAEVAEVMELPLRVLRAGYSVARVMRDGVAIRTDTYRAGERLVWGATARILSELLDRIRPLLAEA